MDNQHYPLFPIVDLFRISKKGRKEINKWNEASKSFIDSNTFVNARDSMDERESGWWIVLWIERENRRERWWIRHGLPSFEIRGQIYNGHGITNFTVAKICSDTPIRLAIDKRLGYPRCPQHRRVFALASCRSCASIYLENCRLGRPLCVIIYYFGSVHP